MGRNGTVQLRLVGAPPRRQRITRRRGTPAHRRPLVPSRVCHAVSALRLAIKSCHDWRGGGTCPAGIGDCDIAGCSCGADTSGLRKTPVSPPLAMSSFIICPGGVGGADGEATDWGEDDLLRCCCR